MQSKRTRGLYDPSSREPFRLSRTKIENFTRCPLCFYLDVRLGISQPPSYPFSLNAAVDHLLKKEFDIHRARANAHPLMERYGIDAVPFDHPLVGRWRENFKGVEALHKPTNFLVFGAVDDIWVNPKKELIVVDYKSTSKNGEVNLNADWQDGYKRQMEVYQWLLRQNKFAVSNTGYFVYANAQRDRKAFDGKLEFDMRVLPYRGDDAWVEVSLKKAHKVLKADTLPESATDCEYCNYRARAHQALASFGRSQKLF